MAERGTFETILAEIGKALLPLKAALSSPDRFYGLLLKLGWRSVEIPAPLQDLGSALSALFTELRALLGRGLSLDGSVSLGSAAASPPVSPDTLLRIGRAVEEVLDGVRTLASAPDAAFPPQLVADNFKSEFPRQLVNHLIVDYLATHQPQAGFLFRALGVTKSRYVPAAGNRPAYLHHTIDFSDLPEVLQRPGLILENAFGWGTDAFDFEAFASQVENLLARLDVETFLEAVPRDVAASVRESPPPPDDPIVTALRAVFFERVLDSGRMAAEVQLLHLPAQGSLKPGLALMPSFNGLLDLRMQLGDDLAVVLDADLDLKGGVALVIRPGRPIDLLVGFEGGAAPTHATGSARGTVERSQLDGKPILLLGKPDATRLQYRKLAGTFGIRLDANDGVDAFAEVELKGLELFFKPDEADGFIRFFFPAKGVAAAFDLAVGLSCVRGFYFRSTSHFEIAIPAHIQIGPIHLESLTIGVHPGAGGLPIDLGVTFKLELGPLTAVVENVGLRATFSFPDDHDGNLGPVDLSLDFKPPKGVGLVVDAGVVRGGGFLYFDPDREEYAGALELVFSEVIGLKAIGLLTTRLPDGSKGFSLLLIISVDFGSGIQLGLGFTLLAVGGLIGLNRTVALQPLLEGVRTGAIQRVMFPEDVVANAPKIISDLRVFFPPQQGTFLIGPMAKIAWGTPPLITLSLGVIIEIPGNVAILGVLKVALPADELPVLVLQVNFVGAIEFDRKRAFLFAALFESRIVNVPIEGEMGALIAWGDDGNLVLSVGGFHPRFSPPPLPFPTPRRIAISLVSTSTARVRIEGYFAVTPNTAQFGASAELFFGLDEISVQGHLAFDALFQFRPFHFVIELSASFSVKVFGIGVFSVRIRGTLDGPGPYRARGEGSISLLFFDISADFDVTWGELLDTLLPAIAVFPLFKAELEKAENWRALLPAGNHLLVSLRKLPPADATLVLHPVGVLRISQRRFPLELTMAKVGNQTPSDVKRLGVAVTAPGLVKSADAFEQFPPAEFQELSDADRLSRPAFGPERGGLDLAAGAYLASSRMVRRVVRYEEIILDSNFKRFARRFLGFPSALFQFFLRGSSVALSELSQAKKRQLQPFAEKVAVQADTWTVAFQATNRAAAPEAAAFASEAGAQEWLARERARDPFLAEELHVIPASEKAS
jgi:hypothetical protein